MKSVTTWNVKHWCNEMSSRKKRTKEVIHTVMAFLGFVILDLIAFAIFGKGMPCVFYKLTGLKCPGCGISRAGIALLSRDWKTAFAYNPLLFSLVPVWVLYLGYKAIQYIKNGHREFAKWEYVFLLISYAVVIGFGILRNVEVMSGIK